MFGMRSWRGLAAALFTVLLVSCGGGGGEAGCASFSTDCDGSGGGGGGTVKAADLSIVLSADELDNNGTSSVNVTVTAVDEGRRALAGIPVSVSVDSEAVVTVSGNVTNDSGVVTAQVGPGSDRSTRTVTVRAVSGELSRTATVRVTGATLTATAVPVIVNSGTTGQVQYRLADKAGNPMRAQPITVQMPGLPDVSGVTGNNGEFNFSYTAPVVSSTTLLTISGNSAGESKSIDVSVQAGASSGIPVVNPALTPVVSASVEGVPNVVGVNLQGSVNNRAEIRALFRTNNNAPVKNIRVRFDLAGDANSIGGTFLAGDNAIYSDAEGAALTAYVPGARSSPTNGVTVRACWDYVDFAAGACPNAATTTLTVAAEAVNVRISTNELIKSGRNDLSYIKEYLITVTDSAGNPKPGVTVTPSVDLLYYLKGPDWLWNGQRWLPNTLTNFPANSAVANSLSVASYLACINEDANRNNVLDVGQGEDINADGQLWPRKSDVLVSLVGGAKTDVNGLAVVQIEYGRSLATWTQFRLTVTAGGISGTEGRDSYVSYLPASGAAAATENPPAPWAAGPYGRNVTSCADAN